MVTAGVSRSTTFIVLAAFRMSSALAGALAGSGETRPDGAADAGYAFLVLLGPEEVGLFSGMDRPPARPVTVLPRLEMAVQVRRAVSVHLDVHFDGAVHILQ